MRSSGDGSVVGGLRRSSNGITEGSGGHSGTGLDGTGRDGEEEGRGLFRLQSQQLKPDGLFKPDTEA